MRPRLDHPRLFAALVGTLAVVGLAAAWSWGEWAGEIARTTPGGWVIDANRDLE